MEFVESKQISFPHSICILGQDRLLQVQIERIRGCCDSEVFQVKRGGKGIGLDWMQWCMEKECIEEGCAATEVPGEGCEAILSKRGKGGANAIE